MSKKLKRLYADLTNNQRRLLSLHVARDYAELQGEKKKSWKNIAEELGVSDRAIRAWKADPAYKEAFRICSMSHLDTFLGEVNSRLMEAIRKGAGNGQIPIKALELYYKVSGLFESRHVIVDEKNEGVRDAESLRRKADELLERFKKNEKDDVKENTE